MRIPVLAPHSVSNQQCRWSWSSINNARFPLAVVARFSLRCRKSDPYRSAMSMLTFYINRAGNDLPASRKKVLNRAKDELRSLYGKEKPRAERSPTAKRKG
ncbi:MAG TPA: DUF3175 domain-containing protein [Gemmatimonadaceae bacterium]|nr:DUF3175 domain-containing protein [Gemmatimonadaceae bacterium]